MIIKRNIYFAVKVRRDSKGNKIEKNLPIRMRVSYNWNYKDFYTGYSIDLDKWDETQQRVRKNVVNKCGHTAATTNSHLNKMLAAMFDTFNEFELLDQIPEIDILTDRFNEKMEGVNVALKAIVPHKAKVDFWKVYGEFMRESSHKRSWTDSTIEHSWKHLRHYSILHANFEKSTRSSHYTKQAEISRWRIFAKSSRASLLTSS